MYRPTIFLIIAAAAAAPQDNSITYIKMLPQTEEPLPAASYRSSRIEDIPLATTKQEESILDTSDNESRSEQTDLTETTLDSTESTEASTEKYEPKTTPEVTRAPPKFYSKLSYFEKPNLNSVVTNLVERTGRRKFRSRCRCEKISNCPKLQITVPRCPEEYFLCCF